MNIVVDASAIIAVIANEPEKSALIELTSGVDLIAPLSSHVEIGNAFSAMLKRHRISLTQAVAAMQWYHSISIRFVDVELEESLRIAAELDIYAYDAYLIHCAKKYRSPLLTLDRGLRRQAAAYGVSGLEVSS